MASDDSVTVISSMQEDDTDDDGLEFDQHQHQHSLSRLSVCTSSMYTTNEDDGEEQQEEEEVDGIDGVMMNNMSRLSIESFDADDEEEFCDCNRGKRILDMSDDSDKEQDCFYYSLPATPPSRRRSRAKDYGSEDEAQKSLIREKTGRNLRRRRTVRERWFRGGKKREDENMNSISGDSDHGGGSGGGGGLVVITRPKGGSRSLCMDMEEVKACRDLGFELEHERMLEITTTSHLSLSASTLESPSSGATSPIANWRISSPG